MGPPFPANSVKIINPWAPRFASGGHVTGLSEHERKSSDVAREHHFPRSRQSPPVRVSPVLKRAEKLPVASCGFFMLCNPTVWGSALRPGGAGRMYPQGGLF